MLTNRIRRLTTRAAGAALVTLIAGGTLLAQDPQTRGQTPLAGAQVFGSAGCARCHAVNGMGGEIGPDLGRTEGARSVPDLGAAMWNHLPQMAQRMESLGVERPRLRADQADALAAFLATQAYFDPRGDPAQGRRVFAAKQCVTCHQVGGVGGVVGPPLDQYNRLGSAIAIAAAMWTHGPSMALEMRARGLGRPTLTADDLRHLVALLSRSDAISAEPLRVLPGNAATGRAIFESRSCAGCHGPDGRGGIGPALAGRAAARSLSDFAATMWNKTPAMMQRMAAANITVPSISDAEMADLVAYLHSINYFAASGDARRGRSLVSDRGCSRCHASGRQASPLRARSQPDLASFLAALWNHVTIASAASRWPTLQPADVADLSAFLLEAGSP